MCDGPGGVAITRCVDQASLYLQGDAAAQFFAETEDITNPLQLNEYIRQYAYDFVLPHPLDQLSGKQVLAECKRLNLSVEPADVSMMLATKAGPEKAHFIGKVLEVNPELGLVFQSIGRNGEGAVFPISSLSSPVEVGKVADITFKFGVGLPAERNLDKDRGRG